jgi:hypothetical protein
VKAQAIRIVGGATGSLSPLFQNNLDDIRSEHLCVELQKSDIPRRAETLKKDHNF